MLVRVEARTAEDDAAVMMLASADVAVEFKILVVLERCEIPVAIRPENMPDRFPFTSRVHGLPFSEIAGVEVKALPLLLRGQFADSKIAEHLRIGQRFDSDVA